MENENNKIADEKTNEQPKPTDDIQLDIETVVPAAHEAEVTTEKAGNKDESKEEQSTDEPKEEKGEKVTEGEGGEEKASTSDDQSVKDEDSSPEETAPEEDEKTESDENAGDHNEIETVTP